MKTIGVYIHIPFCQRRCGYCDFNTYAGINHLIGDYVEAVCAELRILRDAGRFENPPKISSIYFGGGTPSLLAPELLGKILLQVRQYGDVQDNAEITMEVNPGTVDQAYLSAVRALGIKRLSIGVQSANPDELKLLDRLHGYTEGVRVVGEAREAGFDNISLDLIYGLPQQKMDAWAKSLDAVLRLEPEHLSLYSLTIEPGTRLEHQVEQGLYPVPDDDLTADMFEYASKVLQENGFSHYEVSNWGRVTSNGGVLLSRHNRHYWLNEPYLGIGAGAHGFIGGYRTVNEMLPFQYIQKLRKDSKNEFPYTPATIEAIPIDEYREMQETLLMGLRLLVEGVPETRFRRRFGKSYWDVFSDELARLLNKGLIETVIDQQGGKVLRMTKQSVFISNQVFQEFV